MCRSSKFHISLKRVGFAKKFPVFPGIRYYPAMNSTSPEELQAIVVLLFRRTFCISLCKIEDHDTSNLFFCAWSRSDGSCLAEDEVWCYSCCNRESENWVIDGKMPGDQRKGHNIFQLSQIVLFLFR